MVILAPGLKSVSSSPQQISFSFDAPEWGTQGLCHQLLQLYVLVC